MKFKKIILIVLLLLLCVGLFIFNQYQIFFKTKDIQILINNKQTQDWQAYKSGKYKFIVKNKGVEYWLFYDNIITIPNGAFSFLTSEIILFRKDKLMGPRFPGAKIEGKIISQSKDAIEIEHISSAGAKNIKLITRQSSGRR